MGIAAGLARLGVADMDMGDGGAGLCGLDRRRGDLFGRNGNVGMFVHRIGGAGTAQVMTTFRFMLSPPVDTE
jgi:hypothetical protein